MFSLLAALNSIATTISIGSGIVVLVVIIVLILLAVLIIRRI
jgi:hypothetical protein